MPVLIAAVALLGLAVGSFLNVVIHRLPLGLSLVRPASRCPSCDEPIRARHNVPVLSWLLLRGRCADCAGPISVRYPLVELATAVLFVAVTVRVTSLDLLPALPGLLFFTAVGIALTAIDLDVRRLPNAIVLPSYAALAILLTGASIATHDGMALLRAGVGAAALFLLYLALALALARPGGMGFGDVKLAGLVGGLLAFLSFQALLVGAFAAFLIGGIVALGVMAARHGSRKTAIPFGPFMVAGFLLALFATAPIVNGYTHLVLTT